MIIICLLFICFIAFGGNSPRYIHNKLGNHAMMTHKKGVKKPDQVCAGSMQISDMSE